MNNIKNTNLIPPSPNIDISTLKPFTRFCCSIGIIPASYLVSMSYEEQLLWLCDFLENTLIPTVNNNGEAVAELQGLYIQLKSYVDNYFTNLDVQEEINNKLDQMVEDGTFSSILNNYAQISKVYNTFQDLLNDKDNLVNNMKIKTLGYYQINDGGNAEYYITNSIVENKYQTDLNNGLFLTLINDKSINVLKLGIKNDGTQDISNVINNNIDLFDDFYFPTGKYLINNTINLKNKVSKSFRGEIYSTYNNGTSTTFIGNTGSNPIFNLLGAIYIKFSNFLLFSDDNTLQTPSVLGILQGCTTEREFSQWIYFTNLHINLISSPNSNNQNGSIGVYNYQSELNSYVNCFFYADIPFVALQDDDFGIATSFGAILPVHDSLTGNNYTNLETQSKLKYTACLSGGGITFTGFYGQGTIKFFTNSRGDNQLNNFTFYGVIENNNVNLNDCAIEIGENARLQNSSFQLTCVNFDYYISTKSSSATLLYNILKFVGNLKKSYSPSSVRYTSNIIYKSSYLIENVFSQGNIVIGGNTTKQISNSNLSILTDGTLIYNGKAISFNTSTPSRTDLPNQSIAFNLANNNFLAWKYSSSNQKWLPVSPASPIKSDTGSISSQTPSLIGQLLIDVNTNDIYIAYGTEQGNWKKITN